jgi:hypothetical protein
MGQAQFADAADVIRDFTHGKLEALCQQYSRGDPKRIEYFDTRILTPGALRLFDIEKPEGGGPSSTPNARPNAIPRPPTFESDPEGTVYRERGSWGQASKSAKQGGELVEIQGPGTGGYLPRAGEIGRWMLGGQPQREVMRRLSTLKAGDVVNGYRFKGGDPSDPNNWEKAR